MCDVLGIGHEFQASDDNGASDLGLGTHVHILAIPERQAISALPPQTQPPRVG